jgi:Relaxase/Mobilisation nuclease domain
MSFELNQLLNDLSELVAEGDEVERRKQRAQMALWSQWEPVSGAGGAASRPLQSFAAVGNSQNSQLQQNFSQSFAGLKKQGAGFRAKSPPMAQVFSSQGVPSPVAAKMPVSASQSSVSSDIDVASSPAAGGFAGILGASVTGSGAIAVFDEIIRRGGGSGGGGGAASTAGVANENKTSFRFQNNKNNNQKQADIKSQFIAGQAAVAAGGMPVVIKVVSRVHSAGSTGNLFEYLGKREEEEKDVKEAGAPEESGALDPLALVATSKVDIPVYTHDGRTLLNAEDRKAERLDWQRDYRFVETRQPVVEFVFKASGEQDTAAAVAAMNKVFAGKGFIYAVNGGVIEAIVQSDVSVSPIVAELKNKTVQTSHIAKEQLRVKALFAKEGVEVEVALKAIAVKSNAVNYAVQKLLVRSDGPKTMTHQAIERKAGVKISRVVEKVQANWPQPQQTRLPVNAYHIVFSARAGTSPDAMVQAVKNFMDEKAQGHKWVTAFHPETGHVHIHVAVKARSDVGKMLRLDKAELASWRLMFAEKAREQGISMFATSRKEFGSSRSYSQGQAAIARKYMAGQRAKMRKPEPVAHRVKDKVQQRFAATGTDQGRAWLQVAAATAETRPEVAQAALSAVLQFTKPSTNAVVGSTASQAKETPMVLSVREFEQREAGIKAKASALIGDGAIAPREAQALQTHIDNALDRVRPLGSSKVLWATSVAKTTDSGGTAAGGGDVKELNQTAASGGDKRNAASRLMQHVANVEAAKAAAKTAGKASAGKPVETQQQNMQQASEKAAAQVKTESDRKIIEPQQDKTRGRDKDQDRGR